MHKISIFAIVSLLAGCAGPRYIRECNELTRAANKFYDVCMADREQDDFLRVELGTCKAENDRLTKIILNEVPK